MKVEEIRREHFVSVVPKVVLQTCKGLASWLLTGKKDGLPKQVKHSKYTKCSLLLAHYSGL